MKSKALIILAVLATAGCSSPKPGSAEFSATTMDGKPVDMRILGVHKPYPSDPSSPARPPKGYKVCHLSHYGRHGSRYIQYDTQYFYVHDFLRKAYEAERLTAEGQRLYQRYKALYPDIDGRSGELCPLGQEQHHQIARRMVQNYPGLFRGTARVVANSTNFERTMLSMMAFCDELHDYNGKLRIEADASRREMGYLNPHSRENSWNRPFDQMWKGVKATWRADFKRHSAEWIDWEGFGKRIFTDMDWASATGSVVNFEKDLYLIAADVACMPFETEGFFDFFTEEELLALAKCGDNYLSYMEKGRSPLSPGRCWALCHTLLEDFMDKADQDLRDGLPVRLRFGHDGCMMGMFVLMDLPGWNGSATTPDEIWDCWDCSAIPMASNLQMALYRSNRPEDPVLMTWRLNEEPMELPLEEVAPGFYRWEDFKAVYKAKCEEAKVLLNQTENLL